MPNRPQKPGLERRSNLYRSRRKLIKRVAAGGSVAVVEKALLENWRAPILESAILPAHAVMTNNQ